MQTSNTDSMSETVEGRCALWPYTQHEAGAFAHLLGELCIYYKIVLEVVCQLKT